MLRGRQTGSTAATSVSPASVVSPEFVLTVKRTGIVARAVQVDGEFTVLAGSGAAGQVRTGAYAASTTNAYAAYRNIHQKLADDEAAMRVVPTVGRRLPRPEPSLRDAWPTPYRAPVQRGCTESP